MRPIGLCFIGFLAVTACALAATGGKPPLFRRDPGAPIPPQKLPAGIKSLSAEACRKCHEEIYNQWKTSQHSKAATGEIWRACWTVRSQPPFCTNCHFPLAQQKPRVLAGFKESGPLPLVLLDKPNFDTALTREGVNCAVCHIRNGTILGPRQFTPKEAEDIPHPVQYDERFTKSEFCYGCHGWSFPRARMSEGLCDGVHSYTKFEWDKKETCQSCHLPRRKGAVAEDYPEREYGAHVEGHLARTPEGLRESLPIEVKADRERYAAGETVNAIVTVTNKAGHTAPTACGVRAIHVVVSLVDGQGNKAEEKTFRLSRAFEFPAYPTETHDTRLAPGETRALRYNGRIPSEWTGRKVQLRAELIYYLVSPRKAEEAPLPLERTTIPVATKEVVVSSE
jgi:hypothetical protein